MKKSYLIEEGEVHQKVEGVTAERKTSQAEFIAELGKQAPFHTGWMPPGLRMYTQAGKRSQAVIECQPGVNLTWWGDYEGDKAAKLYELAQPYRVIIADFLNNTFYGARMFYSPVPINGPDTILYHANVPNLNCRGYGGNGVGWICLYHNNLVPAHRPLGEKIAQVIERCSGAEAYNDANMSETDGPRFYRNRKKPKYLWNPRAWEQKSEEEGFEWTLDDDLWIPIRVKSKDEQSAHYDDGELLTLGMAVEGQYMAYYNDTNDLTPAQCFRQGKDFKPEDILNTTFNNFQSEHFGTKTLFPLPSSSVSEEAGKTEANQNTCPRCEENVVSKQLGPSEVCADCFSRDYYCVHCHSIKRRYVFVNEELCKLCYKKGLGSKETTVKVEAQEQPNDSTAIFVTTPSTTSNYIKF